MVSIRAFAPAKINLTLAVAGRRSDGLHEIASLVVFANAGDWVLLDTGREPAVVASGPFSEALAGPNILDRALALIQDRAPQISLGSVHLEKHLPVAAGIGGGSADAGALLRAVRQANGAVSDGVDWLVLAGELGADVPVCFEARSQWMTGSGDRLVEIAGGVPPLAAVLVNPMAAVPADKTARVFRALDARSLDAGYAAPPAPRLSGLPSLLDFVRAHGNDLACAAETVVPETGAALSAIAALPGCAYAGVSGAGPTCFGIFSDEAAAKAGRAVIASKHPAWWVVDVRLG